MCLSMALSVPGGQRTLSGLASLFNLGSLTGTPAKTKRLGLGYSDSPLGKDGECGDGGSSMPLSPSKE